VSRTSHRARVSNWWRKQAVVRVTDAKQIEEPVGYWTMPHLKYRWALAVEALLRWVLT